MIQSRFTAQRRFKCNRVDHRGRPRVIYFTEVNAKIKAKGKREETTAGGGAKGRGKVSSHVLICSFIYASSCLCCFASSPGSDCIDIDLCAGSCLVKPIFRSDQKRPLGKHTHSPESFVTVETRSQK